VPATPFAGVTQGFWSVMHILPSQPVGRKAWIDWMMVGKGEFRKIKEESIGLQVLHV